MDIYFQGLNILTSTFCVCADGFRSLSKANSKVIQRSKIIFETDFFHEQGKQKL
jgi:hypothetical protein